MLARNHLSRHGEQIHVRLDVHVVGDGIDAPEGVRDLPVEVPEELLMIVSIGVDRLQKKGDSPPPTPCVSPSSQYASLGT